VRFNKIAGHSRQMDKDAFDILRVYTILYNVIIMYIFCLSEVFADVVYKPARGTITQQRPMCILCNIS